VAILLVGAGAAGFFLSKPHSSTSSSTSTGSVGTSQSNTNATGGPFNISYDTLVVGYKGGLFQLGFQDNEGKPMTGVVAVLNINATLQAVMCSGGGGSGLGFGNCLPGGGKSYTFSPATGGSFPANTTFSGYDSGAGAGGAVAGHSYPLIITATYVDGTSSTETISVQAASG
jgi:hypothetical protein